VYGVNTKDPIVVTAQAGYVKVQYTIHVTVDTTAPELTVTAPVNGSALVGEVVKFEGFVTDSDPYTSEATVAVLKNGVKLGTITTNANGFFSKNVAVGYDNAPITLVATDNAGNASAPQEITLNIVKPGEGITIVSPKLIAPQFNEDGYALLVSDSIQATEEVTFEGYAFGKDNTAIKGNQIIVTNMANRDQRFVNVDENGFFSVTFNNVKSSRQPIVFSGKDNNYNRYSVNVNIK
jgi:hypothetical protein